MLRWFRLLVIALLLPAYSLAAITTPTFAERPAQAAVADKPATPGDDIAPLIDELGDTSDDIAGHCLSHGSPLLATQPPAAPPSLSHRLAVDAPLARLLRPPRAR